MEFGDGIVLIVHFDPFGPQVVVDRGNCSGSDPSGPVDSFRLNQYFVKPEKYSASDSLELRASCFPFDLV